MTAPTRTRVTVGTCTATTGPDGWTTRCRRCDQTVAGPTDHDTAVQAAVKHFCEPVVTDRSCSVCGGPGDGNWCSASCHRDEEPDAYEPGSNWWPETEGDDR